MTNPEKKETTASQLFPRIPKSRVDRFIRDVWESKPDFKKRAEMEDRLRNLEPFLWTMIEEFAEAYGSEHIIVGAYFTYELLSGLELPVVSKGTKEVLDQEFLNFYSGGGELVNPGMYPYEYAEENPSLMVWMAGLSDDIQVGGMLVYELKRRQLHVNKLSQQMDL